jgi:rhodanese-related sulfurtransferase
MDWLKFRFNSELPKDDPNIKGLHRGQLILAMFASTGYTFKNGKGFIRKATGEIIASTPKDTMDVFNNEYKPKQPLTLNIINSYPQLMEYIKSNFDPKKHKKVAMFCTGGIRCEKASSYMKSEGFDEVYHLEGGILKYLEKVKSEDSLWQGECFVFDQRVAIKHGLEVGDYDQCYACRYPLSSDDLKSDKYTPGISCPHCHDQHTPKKLKSLTERQRQVILAKARGFNHIGQTNTDYLKK